MVATNTLEDLPDVALESEAVSAAAASLGSTPRGGTVPAAPLVVVDCLLGRRRKQRAKARLTPTGSATCGRAKMAATATWVFLLAVCAPAYTRAARVRARGEDAREKTREELDEKEGVTLPIITGVVSLCAPSASGGEGAFRSSQDEVGEKALHKFTVVRVEHTLRGRVSSTSDY